MKLKDILKIANYAREKTRELVPYSSNRPSLKGQPFHRSLLLEAVRSQNDAHGDRKQLQKWHLDISSDKVSDAYPYRRVKQTFFGYKGKNPNPTLEEWHEYIKNLPKRRNKMKHKNGDDVTQIELIESRAKSAVNFGIGNCSEMSATAFTLLLEYPKLGLDGLPPITDDVMIERAYMDGKGDHMFIVLNRNVNGDINDLSTWGPEAIILDPWMNDVVIVADELKNPRSRCFKYIRHYQADLRTDQDDLGYISDGHSLNWSMKRTVKNEPYFLCNWTPVVHDGANVPWAEDYAAKQSNMLKK